MPKLIFLPLLALLVVSAPLNAKNNDSSLEKTINDIAREDDHPGKGTGRPDNPGKHGRENAAEKQSRGHGDGSKKNDSWEDKSRNEFDGDEKNKNKNKNKNK